MPPDRLAAAIGYNGGWLNKAAFGSNVHTLGPHIQVPAKLVPVDT